MRTYDFTGTYDYEVTEAYHAAQYIFDELFDGYLDSWDELHGRIDRERRHWKKYLPETFDVFDQHFIFYLRKLQVIDQQPSSLTEAA